MKSRVLQRLIFTLTLLAMALHVTPSRGNINKWYWPVEQVRISSGIGWRINPITHKRQWHNGLDLATPTGSRVHASGDGVIHFAGWWGGFGNLVVINHGGGYFTLYGHLSKPLVRPGDRVSAGDVVALSGNTGRSTGAHLHFEARWWKDGPQLQTADETVKAKPADEPIRFPDQMYDQAAANTIERGNTYAAE